MKVLVIVETADPNRYWEDAVPLLSKNGIDVSFATIGEKGDSSETLAKQNTPVYSCDAKNSKSYPLATLRLASIIRNGNFDIIHASDSIPASISGLTSFMTRKAIRLFHRHHNSCPQNTKLFHHLANKTSDFMMTCSKSTQEYAVEVDGFDQEKVRVAYNGINPLREVSESEINGIRQSLEIPANAKIISIVARLREEKGHLILFKAANLVSKSISEPIHIVVTGKGDFDSELKKAAREFNTFKVHFVGHQEDVAPWYVIGDVTAMPSYYESFGLVAAEAMSCGQPLIASEVGGLLEVVKSNEYGILVPPKDEKSLAEAILRIFKSPELAKRLGESGKLRVSKEFTMEKMVSSWIDYYNFILEEWKRK